MMCKELGYTDREENTRERSVHKRESERKRERAREIEQERGGRERLCTDIYDNARERRVEHKGCQMLVYNLRQKVACNMAHPVSMVGCTE